MVRCLFFLCSTPVYFRPLISRCRCVSQTIRFCGRAPLRPANRPASPPTPSVTNSRTNLLLLGDVKSHRTGLLSSIRRVRLRRRRSLRQSRSRPSRIFQCFSSSSSSGTVSHRRAAPPVPVAGTSRTRRKSRGSPLGVHRRPRLLAFRHWLAALPVERHLHMHAKETTSTSRRSLRRLLVRIGIRCQRITTRDRCCCDLGRIAPLDSSSLVLPARVLVTRPTRPRTRSRLEMTSATPRLARRRVTVTTTTKPRCLAPPLCPIAAVNRPLTPFPLLLPSPIPIPTRSLQRTRTERRLRIRTRLRSVVVGATTIPIVSRRLERATGTTRGGVEVLLPGGLRESRTVTVPLFVDAREEVRRRRRDLCALMVLATMTRAVMTTAGTTTTTTTSGSGRLPPLPRIGLLLSPSRLRHYTTQLRCTTTTAVPAMRPRPPRPPRRLLRVASTCSERPTLHGPPPRVVPWSALDHH